MLNDDSLQYNGLLGSNVNGKDLVRLSVGTTAMVFVFIPFTMLLVIALVLIFKTSIEFVIFGSFVPYSVFVISFFQIQLGLQNLFLSDQFDNHHQVI